VTSNRDDWETVYDLRTDTEMVRLIQDASLNKPGFGFVSEPALFGSPDWWVALDAGALPVSEFCGTITRVYMGSMGDWPEFEAVLDDGTTRGWTREGRDEAYVVGRRVCVRTVRQRYKPDSYFAGNGQAETNVPISIRIAGETTPRS
jgi:hypothetical protein